MTAQEAQAKMDELRAFFFETMEGSKEPYWVLFTEPTHRGHGSRVGSGDSTDLETSWSALEQAVMRWLANGKRRFMLKLAKGGKHDRYPQMYPVDFSEPVQVQGTPGTNIAGIFGPPATAAQGNIGMASIAAMLDKKDLEWEMKFRDLENRRHLDEKDAQIEALRSQQRSTGEQVLDFFKEVFGSKELLQGIVAIGALVKGTPPPPGLVNLAGPPAGAKPTGTTVERQTAPPGAIVPPEEAELPPQAEKEDLELDDDDWKAVLACRRMKTAGVPQAGDKIGLAVDGYLTNPMVAQFVNSMAGAQPPKPAADA